MKNGLILEGGALRSVFTAGVMVELTCAGITFPYAVGVSAGACLATLLAAGQIEDAFPLVAPGKGKDRWFGLGAFLRTGSFIDMRRAFCQPGLPDYARSFRSPMEFESAVTNLQTGKVEYLTERSDPERAFRIVSASSAIPLTVRPVLIDGVPYVDGAQACSIPAARAMEVGCDRVLAVLCKRRGYVPQVSRTTAALFQTVFRAYPEAVASMLRRPESYKGEIALLERLEAEGRALVIRPELPTIRRLETDRALLEEYYNHGREIALRELPKIRAFLAGKEAPRDGD